MTSNGNVIMDDPVYSTLLAKPVTQRKIAMFGLTPLEKKILASLSPRDRDGNSGYEELFNLFLATSDDPMLFSNYQSHMNAMVEKGAKIMPYMTPLGLILRGATSAATIIPDQLTAAQPEGRGKGAPITLALSLPSISPAPAISYKIPMYESPMGGISPSMVKTVAAKMQSFQALVTTDTGMLARLSQVTAYVHTNENKERVIMYELPEKEKGGMSVTDVFLNAVKDAMISEGVNTILSPGGKSDITSVPPAKGTTAFKNKTPDSSFK
jgi:hypothetical protein